MVSKHAYLYSFQSQSKDADRSFSFYSKYFPLQVAPRELRENMGKKSPNVHPSREGYKTFAAPSQYKFAVDEVKSQAFGEPSRKSTCLTIFLEENGELLTEQ